MNRKERRAAAAQSRATVSDENLERYLREADFVARFVRRWLAEHPSERIEFVFGPREALLSGALCDFGPMICGTPATLALVQQIHEGVMAAHRIEPTINQLALAIEALGREDLVRRVPLAEFGQVVPFSPGGDA